MPRILVKESNFEQLQRHQPYTIIIRTHGLIIKQITNDELLENILILKIEPLQIKKLELQELNKEYVLFMVFTLDNVGEYNCTFLSLELPITVLFDKLMKVIDPSYEETSLLSEKPDLLQTSSDQNQNNFLLAVDQFIKKTQFTVSQPVIKGLEIIQLGMKGLEKTLKSSIQSLSAPFIRKEENYQDLINKTVPTTEFLLQINKIYLNHIDTALEINTSLEGQTKNSLLLAEQGKFNANELDRPTIIFIHPFGLDLTFWDPYINYFYSTGYRIIAYDMRGWSGSEQANGYKFSDYYSDLIEILKEKGVFEINNNVTIITGSITGLMLLNKADNELTKIKNLSLVLLSSSDKIGKDIQDLIKKIPSPRTWGPLKKVGRNKFKEMILTKGIEESEIQDKLITTLLGSDNKVVMETLKNLKSGYTDGIGEKDIKKLPFGKILLITGEKDLFMPLTNVNHLKNSKNFKVEVIENGNHFIAFEKPELIIAEIHKWLMD